MCYLLTAVKGTGRVHSVKDTEAEVKENAEALLRDGYNEVIVWQRFAVPRLEQSVTWADR